MNRALIKKTQVAVAALTKTADQIALKTAATQALTVETAAAVETKSSSS